MNLHDILNGAPDWTGALCAQSFPDLFYPEQGRSTKEALDVCARCPIIDRCREFIMATEPPTERWGVWAGLTPVDRAKLARRTRAGAAA